MMDLDILVPKDEALRAFEVLLAGGLVRHPQCLGMPEAQMMISPHLPPLCSASGVTMVEVHSRLSKPKDEQDETDPSYDPAFWNRAITRQVGAEALFFPSPSDLLLHLIVHAVYGHQLSNGPLILSDIAYLVRTQAIDWTGFWKCAEQGGYGRACWLMLRLVVDAWGEQSIGWPLQVPTNVGADKALEAAATLMLREIRVASDTRIAEVFEQQESRRDMLYLLLNRLIPSKVQIAAIYPVPIESIRIYLYYLKRLWRLTTSQRLSRYLKSRRKVAIRSDLQQLRELECWLQG